MELSCIPAMLGTWKSGWISEVVIILSSLYVRKCIGCTHQFHDSGGPISEEFDSLRGHVCEVGRCLVIERKTPTSYDLGGRRMEEEEGRERGEGREGEREGGRVIEGARAEEWTENRWKQELYHFATLGTQ